MDLKKRNILIIVGSVVGILIIIGIIIGLANREYRQDSVNVWQQVMSDSRDVAQKSNDVTDETTAREFTTVLEGLEDTVSIQKSIVVNLNSKAFFYIFKNNSLPDVLTTYNDYLKVLITITKDPINFSDKETQDMTDLSTSLKEKITTMISTTFISDQLPNEILNLPQKLVKIRDDYQKAQKLEEEKISAEQTATAQVESNVTKFLDAYLARDKAGVKRYMTDAYEKEFDFTSFDYPDSSKNKNYRILGITKKSETEYEVVAVLNYTYQYDGEQEYVSSSMHTIRVVLDPKYNHWLVDRMDYKQA